MAAKWHPPFWLYGAGRETVQEQSYYNDTRSEGKPRRILIKHTLSGCGVLYVDKRRFPVPEGHIFVIERPGPYIYLYEENGEPWSFEFVSIAHALGKEIIPATLLREPVFSLKDSPELSRQFTEMIALRLREGEAQTLKHSAFAYSFFLSYIATRLPDLKPPAPDPALALRERIEEATSEVHIGHLARELGYSHEALTRLFSSSYGMPPAQYSLKIRIARACRMLKNGEMPIKQIAAVCGFADANYFGRAFKKLTSMTPGSYRRNPDPLVVERLRYVSE